MKQIYNFEHWLNYLSYVQPHKEVTSEKLTYILQLMGLAKANVLKLHRALCSHEEWKPFNVVYLHRLNRVIRLLVLYNSSSSVYHANALFIVTSITQGWGIGLLGRPRLQCTINIKYYRQIRLIQRHRVGSLTYASIWMFLSQQNNVHAGKSSEAWLWIKCVVDNSVPSDVLVETWVH